MNRKMLLLLSLITLLQFCVVCGDSCRKENVSGGEGGDVILHVNQTGIRFINWVLLPEGNVIVRTKPDESIDDDELIEQYKGRLRSEDDGSLHLYRLSPQDQRMYSASIRTTEGNLICVQFNLTVYEILSPGDIQITPTITNNDTCSLALFCFIDKRDVTITWSSVDTGDINVTRGVLYVPPRGVNFIYICTVRNPVSNVSKTVIPGEYCESKLESKEAARVHLLGILGITPVLVIIFILAWILHTQWKKGRCQDAEITTTYAQVEAQQTQQQNLYHERQDAKTESVTLYSEVQHTKQKKNPQKKLIGKDAKTVETVYSEVTIPKENGQNGMDAQSPGPSVQSNITDVKKKNPKKTVVGKEKSPLNTDVGKEKNLVESVYSTVGVGTPKE